MIIRRTLLIASLPVMILVLISVYGRCATLDDLILTCSTEIRDETLIINGNISISNNSKVNIINSTIQFNDTYHSHYNKSTGGYPSAIHFINVTEKSTLIFENSCLQANITIPYVWEPSHIGTASPYSVTISDSSLIFRDSELSGFGFYPYWYFDGYPFHGTSPTNNEYSTFHVANGSLLFDHSIMNVSDFGCTITSDNSSVKISNVTTQNYLHYNPRNLDIFGLYSTIEILNSSISIDQIFTSESYFWISNSNILIDRRGEIRLENSPSYYSSFVDSLRIISSVIKPEIGRYYDNTEGYAGTFGFHIERAYFYIEELTLVSSVNPMNNLTYYVGIHFYLENSSGRLHDLSDIFEFVPLKTYTFDAFHRTNITITNSSIFESEFTIFVLAQHSNVTLEGVYFDNIRNHIEVFNSRFFDCSWYEFKVVDLNNTALNNVSIQIQKKGPFDKMEGTTNQRGTFKSFILWYLNDHNSSGSNEYIWYSHRVYVEGYGLRNSTTISPEGDQYRKIYLEPIPDLIPSIVHPNMPILAKHPITFYLIIENNGLKTVINVSVDIIVYTGSYSNQTVIINEEIGPGDHYIYQYLFVAPEEESFQLIVIVDQEDMIPELNETNNQYSLQITTTPKANPSVNGGVPYYMYYIIIVVLLLINNRTRIIAI